MLNWKTEWEYFRTVCPRVAKDSQKITRFFKTSSSYWRLNLDVFLDNLGLIVAVLRKGSGQPTVSLILNFISCTTERGHDSLSRRRHRRGFAKARAHEQQPANPSQIISYLLCSSSVRRNEEGHF